MKNIPTRFDYLLKTIEKYGCKSILEIGVCRCKNALHMIQKAKANGEVIYYGFDMFETLTDDLAKIEKSQRPMTYCQAMDKLNATGVQFCLFPGDSTITLPQAIISHNIGIIDLIFIDGGHSYKTTKADWNNIQPLMGKNTIVFFDDYMPNKGYGIGPAKVVDEIDRDIFTIDFPAEAVDDSSRMVKITKRKSS